MAVVLLTAIVTAFAACGSRDSPAPGPPFVGSVRPVSTNPNPNPSRSTAVLRAVRLTEEAGFDGVVFEFEGQLPAAEIEYQQRAIGCGTGEPTSIRGSPVLVVRFDGAVAHDDQGRLTVAAREFDGPGQAVQQVKLTCDFEGELTWAVGVSGQKPFRVTTLVNPPRLQLDVGWPSD